MLWGGFELKAVDSNFLNTTTDITFQSVNDQWVSHANGNVHILGGFFPNLFKTYLKIIYSVMSWNLVVFCFKSFSIDKQIFQRQLKQFLL